MEGKPIKGQTTRQTTIQAAANFIEIYICGPYRKTNGELNTYGHVALRLNFLDLLHNEPSDFVYDFGRYGNVWGIGGSEGTGILRVWGDHNKYILSETATGRYVHSYRYHLKQLSCGSISAYYEKRIMSAALVDQDADKTSYKLLNNYHAVHLNCCTIVIYALVRRGVYEKFLINPEKYAFNSGLQTHESIAGEFYRNNILIRLFTPNDFERMLICETKPAKQETYIQEKKKNEVKTQGTFDMFINVTPQNAPATYWNYPSL